MTYRKSRAVGERGDDVLGDIWGGRKEVLVRRGTPEENTGTEGTDPVLEEKGENPLK